MSLGSLNSTFQIQSSKNTSVCIQTFCKGDWYSSLQNQSWRGCYFHNDVQALKARSPKGTSWRLTVATARPSGLSAATRKEKKWDQLRSKLWPAAKRSTRARPSCCVRPLQALDGVGITKKLTFRRWSVATTIPASIVALVKQATDSQTNFPGKLVFDQRVARGCFRWETHSTEAWAQHVPEQSHQTPVHDGVQRTTWWPWDI